MYKLKTNRALSLGALCLLLLMASSLTVAAENDGNGGKVLPADANPYGYTLDKMAQLLALFDSSFNLPQYYPQTPFQVLSADYTIPSPRSVNVTCSNGVTTSVSVAMNSFLSTAEVPYFVPLFFVDDSPPVLGTFPTDNSMAQDYFFQPSQLGLTDTEVIVDGKVTPIGREFVGGPIEQSNPKLLDGGGTHLAQLGPFLRPLRPGTHTVEIRGSADGLDLGAGSCFAVDNVYTVKVFPRLPEVDE